MQFCDTADCKSALSRRAELHSASSETAQKQPNLRPQKGAKSHKNFSRLVVPFRGQLPPVAADSDFGFRISSRRHSVSGQFLGHVFERVMQQVTDVPDLQSGARADFLVGQIFGELQPDNFAAAIVERFEA